MLLASACLIYNTFLSLEENQRQVHVHAIAYISPQAKTCPEYLVQVRGLNNRQIEVPQPQRTRLFPLHLSSLIHKRTASSPPRQASPFRSMPPRKSIHSIGPSEEPPSPINEREKELLKLSLDAISNALSKLENEMLLSKSLQDLSTQMDAIFVALPSNPQRDAIHDLWNKIEAAISDESWQRTTEEQATLGNARTAGDVLKLLKTLDNHKEVWLGNPQIGETTVEGKAHLSLNWWREGKLARSQIRASDLVANQIRKISTINALGYFRDFRLDTPELWKSLHSVRKRKRFRAQVIYHTEEFNGKSIDTIYGTVEKCLRSQISMHSRSTFQVSVDQRRVTIAGPRYSRSVDRIIRMSSEESDDIACCLNEVLLPILRSLWDDVDTFKGGRVSKVMEEELVNWRQKAQEGEVLHRLANFKSGATESPLAVVPNGSRVIDFRVLLSLSKKLAALGSKDPVQVGNKALQRYVCDWAKRKAFNTKKADEVFETLMKGLTLILDLDAKSSTSPGLSINIAASEDPRNQSSAESFYVLSCDGSIPSETIALSTIRTPESIMSKVSHGGSVLYLDALDSTWETHITSFTRASSGRMRGVESRLYSLSSKLEARQAQLEADTRQRGIHHDNFSRIMSIMVSALKQEEQAPKKLSRLEVVTPIPPQATSASSTITPGFSTAPPSSLSYHRFVPVFSA